MRDDENQINAKSNKRKSSISFLLCSLSFFLCIVHFKKIHISKKTYKTKEIKKIMIYTKKIAIAFAIIMLFQAPAAVELKKTPPVLLVSFDGTRADKFNQFILKYPDSNFAKFARESAKAKHMKPSFPSSTFPNHW